MLKLPLAPPIATELLRRLEEKRRWRALGGLGSGNFGHSGRPGRIGGSSKSGDLRVYPSGRTGGFSGGVYGVSRDALELRPHMVPIYHQSTEEFEGGKPDFDAYFGTEQFLKDFPQEFGPYTYELNLSKNTPILDLNKSSHDASEFMAQMAEQAFPDDKEWPQQLRDKNPAALEDFYDIWTDKNIALSVLRELPGLAGVKYQDEYILPNKTIRQLTGQGMRTAQALYLLGGPGSGNFGHAGRPGEVGGSAPASGSGAFTADAAKAAELKQEWSKTNTQLITLVKHPDSPEAHALLQRQKEIVSEMQRLQADPGGLEGIGQPGGPRDVIVVGAGPGGLSAAIGGATEGLDTVVIDGNTDIGGQAKFSSRIENYPGYPVGVAGDDLAQDMFTQATRVGAEAKLGVKAEGFSYDPETGMKTITLSNGETIQGRTVILGMGVEARTLPFPGNDSPSVTYMDAAKCARQSVGGDAVIIGGSNGAAQAALSVANSANSVTLLARSPLTKSMSAYQRGQIEVHPKIKTIIGDEIASLELNPDRTAKLVHTKNGQTLPAKAVGVFVGSKPNLDWLPTNLTLEKGKIKTNFGMETSIPGVFAVGDNRAGSAGRIISAAGDGQIAVRGIFDYFSRLEQQQAAVQPVGGQ